MTEVPGYKICERLGSGSRGVAFLARSLQTCEEVCVKVCKRSRLKKMKFIAADHTGQGRCFNGLDELSNEIQILQSIQHTNILSLLSVVVDDEEDTVSLVFPYSKLGPIMLTSSESGYSFSGAVAQLLTSVDFFAWLRSIVIQLTRALLYLHQHGIAHRDFKPDNLLLFDGIERVVVADFGCSRQYPVAENPQGLVADTLGTPAFWAPECLQPAKYGVKKNVGLVLDTDDDSPASQSMYSAFALDSWAFGVSLYILVFRKMPFRAKTTLELFDVICSQEIDWTTPAHTFPEQVTGVDHLLALQHVQPLLDGLLSKDPSERWSLDNVLDYLQGSTSHA